MYEQEIIPFQLDEKPAGISLLPATCRLVPDRLKRKDVRDEVQQILVVNPLYHPSSRIAYLAQIYLGKLRLSVNQL